MMKLMTINSMMFMLSKHPISTGTILMMQTMTMSMMMFKKSSMSWFSYILFITIIGGLMVMFIYMSSISSNEKFKMKKNTLLWMIILMTMIMSTKNEIMVDEQKMNNNMMYMLTNQETPIVSKFFNKNKMNMTMIMMMIMLVTMISVTNISMTHKGPLKKTYV